MSLLMEALRKAEEAKSKAAKEDTSQDAAEVTNTSADAPMADDFQADSPQAETTASEPNDTRDETDEGPAVINPDPDEEELLATHSGDKVFELEEREDLDTVHTQPDDDTEQVEFATADPVDGEAETATSNDDYFSEDDGLSLLQSTYFSRTKKSSSSLEDEFGDLLDDQDQDEVSPDQAALAESANETPREPPQQAPVQPPRDEAVDSLAAATTAHADETPPAPAAEQVADKAREKTNRDSASSLFLAKEDSRKRRLKKLVSIAAIVVLFPLAGIAYWLFTSMNSSSSMQFNVQNTGNLANRSLSDVMVETESQTNDQATIQDNAQEGTAAVTNETNALAAATVETTPEPDGGELAGNNDGAAESPGLPLPQESLTAVANEPASGTRAPASPAPAVPQPPASVATPANPAANTAPASETQSTGQQEGLSFSRTAPEQIINPDLNAAYDSYQQGDYAVAGRLYQQVLQSEPNNRDAMLHLASVYLKQNNPAMAQNLYTRLLELNPRDPLARAGLLETVQGDPVRQEAELKSLTAAYPDTAQLSFALGNLYASQNRWSEAQSAYFNALLSAKATSTGPVSPDYAFNLAVSLERINQLRAALDYYREAKALSGNTTPGFNPAVLDQRLNVLEQRLR